jgi:hypothetical protein
MNVDDFLFGPISFSERPIQTALLAIALAFSCWWIFVSKR